MEGHIRGLISHLKTDGMSHLQGTDDTIFLIELAGTRIANLKVLTLCLENMFRIKINFNMIEVVDDELPHLGLFPNLLLWPPSEFEDHNGGLGFFDQLSRHSG
jgi:hypothetical protein